MLRSLTTKGLIWPALLTLVGLAILIGLGTWQLERMRWKEGLIARIHARTLAAPVDADAATSQLLQTRDLEYVRVRARGRLLYDKEHYLYAPDQKLGPGWHVYTPLEIAPAHVIWINRGYVPDRLKSPDARQAGQVDGEVEVTGLVRMPGQTSMFTPDNAVDKNIWYWRDLAGMTAASFPKSDIQALPFFIDAEAAASAPGGWPKGGTTIIKLPNRHLEYALTWYGLAAALAAIFVIYAQGLVRRAPDDQAPISGTT